MSEEENGQPPVEIEAQRVDEREHVLRLLSMAYPSAELQRVMRKKEPLTAEEDKMVAEAIDAMQKQLEANTALACEKLAESKRVLLEATEKYEEHKRNREEDRARLQELATRLAENNDIMAEMLKQKQEDASLKEQVATLTAQLESVKKEKDKAYRQSTDYFQLALKLANEAGHDGGMLTREKDPEWPLLGIELEDEWIECHVAKNNLLCSLGLLDRHDVPWEWQERYDAIVAKPDHERELDELYEEGARKKRKIIQEYVNGKHDID